jgi:hypothetical protein
MAYVLHYFFRDWVPSIVFGVVVALVLQYVVGTSRSISYTVGGVVILTSLLGKMLLQPKQTGWLPNSSGHFVGSGRK